MLLVLPQQLITPMVLAQTYTVRLDVYKLYRCS